MFMQAALNRAIKRLSNVNGKQANHIVLILLVRDKIQQKEGTNELGWCLTKRVINVIKKHCSCILKFC